MLVRRLHNGYISTNIYIIITDLPAKGGHLHGITWNRKTLPRLLLYHPRCHRRQDYYNVIVLRMAIIEKSLVDILLYIILCYYYGGTYDLCVPCLFLSFRPTLCVYRVICSLVFSNFIDHKINDHRTHNTCRYINLNKFTHIQLSEF